LVEEFFSRVIVEINSLIGATDHHHHHVRMLVEEMSVCDWGLEQMLVPLYPVLKIKCCALCHKSTSAIWRIKKSIAPSRL
jgi:hypothetical protein